MRLCLAIVSILAAVNVLGQTGAGCSDYKEGIFYTYQKNTTARLVIYRSGNEQKEVNPDNGDSALWKIEWLNDCSYTLKLKATNIQWKPAVLKVLNEHKFVYTILKADSAYYTFKGSVDNSSNPKIIEDTIWLSEKLHPGNTELFKQVRTEAEAGRITDTSKYALLYIFRPGKLTNSLSSYMVYFDNIPLCVAANNSGYIFKLLKEGRYQVMSRLFKDEAVVDIDVKFGQVIYVKSMIHWGISGRLYNFRLEMAKLTPQQGTTEFAGIKNK